MGEWVRGFGLWFNNPVVTWDMCMCFGCGGVVGVGRVGGRLGPGVWEGVVMLSLCLL